MSHWAARDCTSSDDADCDARSERKLGEDGAAGEGADEAAVAADAVDASSVEDEAEVTEVEGVAGRNDEGEVRNGCCAAHGERMVGADEEEPRRRRANAEVPLDNGEDDADEGVDEVTDASKEGDANAALLAGESSDPVDGEGGTACGDTGPVCCRRNGPGRAASCIAKASILVSTTGDGGATGSSTAMSANAVGTALLELNDTAACIVCFRADGACEAVGLAAASTAERIGMLAVGGTEILAATAARAAHWHLGTLPRVRKACIPVERT